MSCCYYIFPGLPCTADPSVCDGLVNGECSATLGICYCLWEDGFVVDGTLCTYSKYCTIRVCFHFYSFHWTKVAYVLKDWHVYFCINSANNYF